MQTPSEEQPLHIVRMTLVLLLFSTGTSIAVFVPAVEFTRQVGADPLDAIIPFTLIVLALHYAVFRKVINRITQVTLALRYLHENRPVSPLVESSDDAFKALTDAVNDLIRDRGDLKTMRGQLVEQISAAAAQEERNRLARDLHDSIKQQVFSMSISAAAAHAHLDSNPTAAREALLDVKQSAQEAMVEMRALLQQLSPAPLEKSGLVQALRDQCEALAYRTGARVQTQFGELPPDDRLPPGTQETLFRIAQEGLSNIARHARAGQVQLDLGSDEAGLLTLCITDDGQGFDTTASSSGMGLGNIRARAHSIGAQITLDSIPGTGTTLTVVVPQIQHETQEEHMQAHYETQFKPIMMLYYRFAGGVAAFLVAASMLTWRLLQRPEGITDDPILMIILAVFAVTAIGAPIFAIWSLGKGRTQATALILSAGKDSRIDYKLRRHQHMAYLIISTAAGWFLPILSMGLGVEGWLRVGIGLCFLGLVVWNYWRMGELYQREIALMRPNERYNELDQRVREVRTSWLSTGLFVPVILFSSLLSGELQLPPQNPDHWMNTSFITVALLLLTNQIIGTFTYRRWRDEAAEEQAAA